METVGLMEMDTDYGCTFEMSVFRAVRQGVFEPSNGSAGCKKSLEKKWPEWRWEGRLIKTREEEKKVRSCNGGVGMSGLAVSVCPL